MGSAAPDFTLTSTEGAEVTLSELRGEPVWIVFNATWCTSCRSEIPDIQAVEESGDVTILSVYMGEDAGTVSEFAERLGLSYLNLPDPDGEISGAYAVPGVPMHYFIDAEGFIRSVQFGSLGLDRMQDEVTALSP